MVLTVTINPAVDNTYHADRLMPGQVNRMRDLSALPGGKGINVTKVLRQFNIDVTATGFLGGYAGEFVENALKELNVTTAFTRVRQATRTNTNIISDDGYVTEILEPGPVIAPFERDKFLDTFEKLVKKSEYVVLSGSLTEGLSVDFYAKLIRICKENDKKTFLDTSGEPLKEGLKEAPYLVKPNRKELEYAAGRRLSTEGEMIQAAYNFIKGGVSRVVVSMGKKGILSITKTRVIKAVPPVIKTVNTVGSGDCVVAACVLAHLQDLSDERMMQLAAGISAANATTFESGVIPKDTMDSIIAGVQVVSL
ncbi:MAG TPA: 1-phosphofructokinase [Lachnospiraceae bacterium]|nr:1-phosphofructokinase [Lachnospiraceae bacterium]